MTRSLAFLAALGCVAVVGLSAHQAPPAAAPTAKVSVGNPLDLPRAAETIVLSAADLKKALGVADLRTVYVRDDAAAKDVLAQPVDLNDDGTFDELVFQADFRAKETRAFTLSVGEKRVFTRDQFRAYGRFVRERRDDFAWENDKTAHRMYGAALETWAQEPLTSSTVDVWFKHTSRLVINDWYMVDDYHRDLGDGADLYSAGKTRGCGGNAPWEAGKLWPSANFRETRVLANGPIRVMFELGYLTWDVNGRQVRERKRITLDAGQRMNRFESEYATDATRPAQYAAGIKNGAGSTQTVDPAAGTLRHWEPVKGNGNFGCAVVMAPASVVSAAEADGNYLLVGKVPAAGPAVYYAGAAWDKGGEIADAAAWGQYVAQFAKRLATPVTVTFGSR
jgi:hypothetical protein